MLDTITEQVYAILGAFMVGLIAHLAVRLNMPEDEVRKIVDDYRFKDGSKRAEVRELSDSEKQNLNIRMLPYYNKEGEFKSYVLVGDTREIKDRLKSLNLKSNPRMRVEGKTQFGWIVSKRNADKIYDTLTRKFGIPIAREESDEGTSRKSSVRRDREIVNELGDELRDAFTPKGSIRGSNGRSSPDRRGSPRGSPVQRSSASPPRSSAKRSTKKASPPKSPPKGTPAMSLETLKPLKVAELRKLLAERGFQSLSKVKRAELIAMLLDNKSPPEKKVVKGKKASRKVKQASFTWRPSKFDDYFVDEKTGLFLAKEEGGKKVVVGKLDSANSEDFGPLDSDDIKYLKANNIAYEDDD